MFDGQTPAGEGYRMSDGHTRAKLEKENLPSNTHDYVGIHIIFVSEIPLH
jgi:hypothetical protein